LFTETYRTSLSKFILIPGGVKTFTGSCSGSKSCGRPAAYMTKYIVGEGLGITLSSILQTFNLKMEKYEGKYEEI